MSHDGLSYNHTWTGSRFEEPIMRLPHPLFFQKIIEKIVDGRIEKFVEDRYASFKTGIGAYPQ